MRSPITSGSGDSIGPATSRRRASSRSTRCSTGLPEDHRRARALAEALAAVEGLEVDLATVQTNIVNVRLTAPRADAFAFADELAERGVGLLPFSDGRLRAVTHRGIGDDDLPEAVAAIEATLGARVAKR